MAWIAAVGSVGAGPSEGRFQIQQRAQVPDEPQQQLGNIGRQALRLIERALTDAGTPGQALDVLA